MKLAGELVLAVYLGYRKQEAHGSSLTNFPCRFVPTSKVQPLHIEIITAAMPTS